MLKDFDVPCEVTVVSAHRTPERMFSFARTAHTRGVKVPPLLHVLAFLFVFEPCSSLRLLVCARSYRKTTKFLDFVSGLCLQLGDPPLQVIIAGTGGAAHLLIIPS